MNLEDAGYKAKGTAEILAALVDSPFVNDLADEMTVASNESR